MARQWVKADHQVFAFPLFLQSETYLNNPANSHSKKIFETVADSVPLYIKDLKYDSSNGTVKKSAIKKAAKQYRKIIEGLPKIDLLIVHSPASSYDLTEHLSLSCPKVAVFDTSDCKTISSDKLNKYEKIYDAFGYTLDSVKSKIESVAQVTKPTFVTRSEIPSFIMPENTGNREERSDVIRLIFTGELAPYKNIDTIINALANVTNRKKFHLDLVGEGSMEPALRRLISNHNLFDNVSFCNSMFRNELLNKFRSSDIFIMASSHLSFGMSYLEAMSQGCVPICVENERIDGIIRDGSNGYILKEKDVEALTKKLNEIAELSGKKLSAVSDAAIKTASNLTQEKIASRYIEEVLSSINTDNRAE